MKKRAWRRIAALGVAMSGLGGAAIAVLTQPVFFVDAAPASGPKVDSEQLVGVVQTLSMRLSPRDFKHPQKLDAVADYIAGELRSVGIASERQPYEVRGQRYQNVIARFGPEAGPRVVVGAHYDVAHGNPGADDNASGVACLLALARLFAHRPPEGPVELVAYTLEEPPTFATEHMGSARHAQSLREAGVELRAMIGLEMLGFFTQAPDSQRYPAPFMRAVYPSVGNFIAVVGRISDASLVRQIKRGLLASQPIPIEALAAPREVPGVDLSDHAAYWDAGYPAVMLTDTAFYRNANYHTPQDTWDTLDYERMAALVPGIAQVVRELATTSPGK